LGLVARRDLAGEALIVARSHESRLRDTCSLKRIQEGRIFRTLKGKNPPGLLRTLIVPLTIQAKLLITKISGLPAEKFRY
jgi:hypothetical protein